MTWLDGGGSPRAARLAHLSRQDGRRQAFHLGRLLGRPSLDSQ